MKPLSQTQEKLPPGWLTQCPWGPHTPEGTMPGPLGPTSNPQLSITVAEGQRDQAYPIVHSHPGLPLPTVHIPPLQAPPGHGTLGTEQFLPLKSSGQAQ